MKGFKDRLHVALLIVLIITVSLNIMNGWKQKQLNQRYERSIRQHEQSTMDYSNYLRSAKARIEERVRKIEQAAVN